MIFITSDLFRYEYFLPEGINDGAIACDFTRGLGLGANGLNSVFFGRLVVGVSGRRKLGRLYNNNTVAALDFEEKKYSKICTTQINIFLI